MVAILVTWCNSKENYLNLSMAKTFNRCPGCFVDFKLEVVEVTNDYWIVMLVK